MPTGDAAYLHRIAIIRGIAGSGVTSQMFEWSKLRACSLGLRYLRLDFEGIASVLWVSIRYGAMNVSLHQGDGTREGSYRNG
ncbi:MAG: hypothetical protein VCD00_15320 [Candidatus Hydrogenedentota bacterium]